MLHVRLFGDMQVLDGARILGPGDFGGRKPRLIFEALAVHRGQQVSKDRLVDILWQHRRPPDHMATLESYISQLRRRLQPGTPPRQSIIRTVPRAYLLDPTSTRTDLDLFDALVEQAGHGSDDETVSLLDRASALASTDLLASSDEAHWAEPIRVDYRERAMRAALQAAELALPNDANATLRLAGRALEMDVLCEPAWRLIMRAHAATGHRDQALHAYRSYSRLLARELRVQPTTDTQQLIARIIATGHRPTDDAGARTADLGVVMDAAIVLFEHENTGGTVANLDNAVAAVSNLLTRAGVSLPPPARHLTSEAPLTIDDSVALRSADAHLLREFGRTVRPEAVHALLKSDREDLAERDSFPTYLSALAERSTRRLRDLTEGNGRTPTVVFGHSSHGYSQMALGWFTHLAGDRALAWHDGPPAPGEHADASTVAAMAELGIDVTGQFPLPWIDGVVRAADVIVTFDGALPTEAPANRQVNWTLDVSDSVDDVRATRDEIGRRVRGLLSELGVCEQAG
ncbi:MAG TPA: BTAD domain-containing putative transcriptional regulator [Pseudonocardiaceae bacterium]|nr:BTAD domain-containing putative transcriptional regulator [Pseudonocardiaceae bacterium]